MAISPKNGLESAVKSKKTLLSSSPQIHFQKPVSGASQIDTSSNTLIINDKQQKKTTATMAPCIVFNLESKISSKVETSSTKKQQAHGKSSGYKALIASGQIDFTKGRSNACPEYQEADQIQNDGALHIEFLNKTFDQTDTSLSVQPSASQKQGIFQNAPAQLAISKSPQSVLGLSIKGAITPPSEKIIIKKSEIRFGGQSPPLSNSPQNVLLSVKQPTVQKKKSEPAQEEKKQSTGTKHLTFDFIKKMLNDQNTAKQNSPKKDGGLRLSLSGVNSPNGTFKKVQKSSVNFVHDMKKHGIDKDLDSLRAMKQLLDNNSPQSVSPTQLMSNHLKKGGQKNPEQGVLAIKTKFKVEDLEGGPPTTLGSAKSQESYTFPFHKRSRSMSPPFDEIISNQHAAHAQSVDPNEEDKNNSTSQEQLQGNVFSRASQRASALLAPQKSFQRISLNSGPVIPDHQQFENVMKATGSPGNNFGSSKPTYSFSLKKHSKTVQKKALSQRARVEQEELERRILSGTEVEEWLESPQRPQTVQFEDLRTEEEKHGVRIHTLIQPLLRSQNINHFSKLGFIGDTDELDEDDLDKDLVDNDDWMFQTFQNGRQAQKPQNRNDENSIDSPDLIPQNLLSSLDLGDNHIDVRQEVIGDDQLSDADLEEGVSIPPENMGRISSLVSDHALDFPRHV